jgi:hypothetical protein
MGYRRLHFTGFTVMYIFFSFCPPGPGGKDEIIFVTKDEMKEPSKAIIKMEDDEEPGEQHITKHLITKKSSGNRQRVCIWIYLGV